MSRYGRMRASFDSDASLGGMTSPPMSPPRHGHPVYFVQSPSRDSMQDGDSLSQSFSRVTPRESPSASPMHPKHFKQSSVDSLPFGTHTPKPGSRRVLPQPSYVAGATAKKGYRGAWAPGSTIVEEEEGIEGEKSKRLSRRCLVWIAIFFTMVAFFAGALLFWAATMPKHPHVSVLNVGFSYFGLEDGVDNSGVPTMVASLNSTATLQLYNPSRFFGYHVKGSPMGFKYLDLSIAGGQKVHKESNSGHHRRQAVPAWSWSKFRPKLQRGTCRWRWRGIQTGGHGFHTSICDGSNAQEQIQQLRVMHFYICCRRTDAMESAATDLLQSKSIASP